MSMLFAEEAVVGAADSKTQCVFHKCVKYHRMTIILKITRLSDRAKRKIETVLRGAHERTCRTFMDKLAGLPQRAAT